jgi:hypothetical protein
MESARPITCVFITFVLIIVSVISTTDRTTGQFTFSDQARAASENELELNCENNEDQCLIEACLGSECSTVGKGLGIPQLFSVEKLLRNDPMSTRSQDNCQISDEKEEISNFNFRASAEESDGSDSTNNLGQSNQIPAAWWDHSGSDILIGMDLGMIKKICNIDVHLNNNAEIENGFSAAVSNGTKSLHKAINEPTSGSIPNSWSTNEFDSLAGRFIQLTIPGVSDFYVDGDDGDVDPVVSEIKVKALPLTQTSRNSSAMSTSAETLTKQISNNATAQLELSPLEFLDAGSDLLNTPMLGSEHYGINQSSLTDMSSTPTSNIYTGDIFLP